MNQWVHEIFPFLFFPAAFISTTAGLEEAKNLAGRRAPPDSDPFGNAEFGKNFARLSRLTLTTDCTDKTDVWSDSKYCA
jgi:hypothetical protein